MSVSRSIENKVKYTLWNFLGPLFAAGRRKPALPVNLQNIHSVLVIRPDRLGDVVLSTPVYPSIKKSMPEVRLTVLVDRVYMGILKDNPFIDEVIPLDRKKPWRALRQLRKTHFNLAFTLNKKFSATASLLNFFSRAALSVGYSHEESEWIHDIQVPVAPEPRHETQNNLELLRAIGIEEISDAPQIHFNDEESQKVDALIRDRRTHPERPLVLIKPGTRIGKWGWDLKNFQAVTELLLETALAEVFIICGPDEETMSEFFLTPLKYKPVLLPVLPIKELARAIQQADILFCNHTGIMHLASAVQTPLLVIFKHGEIPRWGPVNTRSIVLEELNNETLTPKSVIENIQHLIQS